jgi:hypothetical protein
MPDHTPHAGSRREFLQDTGRIAAATALASIVVPNVHAAEDNTIRLALVGCGGRGSGAAADALSVTSGPIQLVAIADVFQKKLDDTQRFQSGLPGAVGLNKILPLRRHLPRRNLLFMGANCKIGLAR